MILQNACLERRFFLLLAAARCAGLRRPRQRRGPTYSADALRVVEAVRHRPPCRDIL